MHFFRPFLYATAAILALLLAASFLSTASLSTKKKNEMSLGMMAEPATLNPLQQADSASGEVIGFLFNGLLKEDENLELTGSLASSWSLSQTTTFQSHTAAEALKVQKILEKEKSAHPEWGILSIARGSDPKQILITLKEPGYETSEAIAQKIPTALLVPFETTESEKKETHLFLAEPIIDFTLRHDVRWHDGVPFTAKDVVFTYHAIMDDRVASPMRTYFELISKIETPDPWHVIVHYSHPFSPALNSWGTSILPAHLLEGTSPLTWGNFFNRHPIGTGPFRFDTWKNNEYVRLTRNPDYFLAHIFHPDRDEKAAKADEARQKKDFDAGLYASYRSNQNSSPTQHASAFPASTVDGDEICGQGAPWLDSIVFRILPDPLTLRLAFETHQVDFWDASPWAVKNFINNPKYELLENSGNSYTYIGWNLKRPFFADQKVRQALAEAVNTPEMIDKILYGKGTLSTGIFTPRMWCFDASIKPFSYNPQEACTLLDQAGWKPGPNGIRERDGKRFSFTLLICNSGNTSRDIATLVQDDLKKIGIEVHIEIYEWTVFLKKILHHDVDAFISAWALSNDCDQYNIWNSDQTSNGGFNYVGYTNPRVDTLLTQLRQEYERPKMTVLAHELQKIIYHDQPYLFLYVPEQTSVLWNDVYRMRYPTDHGWVDSPIKSSKAGWSYNMEWFYRVDHKK